MGKKGEDSICIIPLRCHPRGPGSIKNDKIEIEIVGLLVDAPQVRPTPL